MPLIVELDRIKEAVEGIDVIQDIEDGFVAYSQDPKAFLKDYLGETAAKSKMSFRLKKGGEDVYAYIVSVSGE